jgi:calcineurin-like phosphoesterase family protein
MNVWFTADTHLGHFNVVKYCSRPWNTVEEMNDGLIERWNSKVKPGDTVYHLGDFCLTKRVDLIDGWLSKLNGTIRLVKGNHDQWTRRHEQLENKDKIKWVKDYVERTFVVDDKKYRVIMSHFPMLFWNGGYKGNIMLHGHSHGGADEFNKDVRRMDVGVDCHDWYPVLLEDVIATMETRNMNPHHKRD